MKKNIPIAVALALILVMAVIAVVAGLQDRQARISDDPPLDLSLQNIEFIEIYFNPSLHGSVAVDRQTGVMYWFSASGAATLLVDAGGKPRVWRDKP